MIAEKIRTEYKNSRCTLAVLYEVLVSLKLMADKGDTEYLSDNIHGVIDKKCRDKSNPEKLEYVEWSGC